MWYFKACPRCLRGDLIREPESKFGPEVGCLQCGHGLSRGEELRLTTGVAWVRQVA